MSITVYLAGAMDYVGDYALGWRKEATQLLKQRDYKVLDPTSIPEEDTMSAEEIVQKNLFMQKRSDILLVEYMLEDRAYIGTDFEMAYAKLNNQPVIAICSKQNSDRPYMKYMSTKLAESVADAVEYISIHYPTNQ
jgi:nucleoside 2-deoxyribosyltransferase